ncbi:MAG: carboxynorspermidine decarboxylase [Candidatus Magasanikbacteria bacterium]|nr:carboxynorspermidine decarboxylase [Candidatus Magasanikbacteria bacterium]
MKQNYKFPDSYFTFPSHVTLEHLRDVSKQVADIQTPAYIIDEAVLEENLRILKKVKDETGCKVLLALKAFSLRASFPLISKYLDGACASGVFEARLGREDFKKEVHTFSPAFSDKDIKDVIKYSDTVIFNSFNQLRTYGKMVKKAGKQVGLRINPMLSKSPKLLYSPCVAKSRLGVIAEQFKGEDLSLVDGFHFHALCEQDADSLEEVLKKFEADFAKYLPNLKWVNIGGGHHVTRKDYKLGLLIRLIKNLKSKYKIQVIMEPGEGVVLNAGYFATTVLDIIQNKGNVAIVDASAETHTPDVLGMPYQPCIIDAAKGVEKKNVYRIGGPSCLAGDTFGDYSFDAPIKPGQKLLFTDMALYTFVKNTTFNGIPLPNIGILDKKGKYKVVKKFGYNDFKNKL